VFRVMTRAQVEAVRNESKNYKYARNKAETVWAKHFEEMGCKTVLRRLMKYVPLSPEFSRAIALDEAADAGIQNTSIEFIDQMPEFTEDVAHEIVTDAEPEDNAGESTGPGDLKDKADAVTKQAEAAAKKATTKKDATGNGAEPSK
jgi:recombination protein RecT